MNVNPISFGRTVRVNAPLKVAEHAANLVNTVATQKGEARVQQQLKTFFYDVEKGDGRARAVAPLGRNQTVFILTGEDSKAVAKLLKDKRLQLEAAKNNYGDSEMYEMVKDAENARFKDLLTLTITENMEPVELNLDYSERKHRIKSIDIVF